MTQSEKPNNRGACHEMERPCPYVSCRFHLYLDVTSRGRIKINPLVTREKDIAEALLALPNTCSLDVADQHPDGITLREAGRRMGVTRERIRQIERCALQGFGLLWEVYAKEWEEEYAS